MSLLGKTIRLSGKTMKGKNRVKEQGNEWTVLAETDRVIFSPLTGGWLFITPLGKTQDDKASRWIRSVTDFDFEIVIPS
jgi:hypothetical protein